MALPLASAILAGLFGRKIGERGAGMITTSLIGITSILSWLVFYEVGLSGVTVFVPLFSWIEIGSLYVPFGLLFDSVTSLMLIIITFISTLVHFYSIGYMKGDPHVPRFMSYLSLFTFFMLVLVTGDNLLQMFIGWEGVGVCSYLLINFWFTRQEANKAAIKAMVVNRVGDLGVVLAMFLIFSCFSALDFPTISSLCYYLKEVGEFDFVANLIGILMLIGVAGKSAQLGLHTWLPDAMEGPTPVSALIHAATMVTAGIFLLIRLSPILVLAPSALIVVTILGSCTAFMAATIGVVQNDIKKVIAYSTCSQLGYMVFACGLSQFSVSLFHLFNHAFFKALLFLSAGCVIHYMASSQDMRSFGSLLKPLPFIYSVMLVGSLSLMGFPFLTGYYSKDAILELALAQYTFSGTFAHWLGVISAFFTAFYSFRLLFLTFLTFPNSPSNSSQFSAPQLESLVNAERSRLCSANSVESHSAPIRDTEKVVSQREQDSLNLTAPLFLLALCSIFIGYFFKDLVIGAGSPFFLTSIAQPSRAAIASLFSAEFLSPFLKWIPVIFSLFGALLGGLCYSQFSNFHTNLPYPLLPSGRAPAHFRGPMNSGSLGRVFILGYTFLSAKWWFDFVFNSYLVKPLFNFGWRISYKVLDRGLLEQFGPSGISFIITNVVRGLSKLQSGHLYTYALTIFIFTIGFAVLVGPHNSLLSYSAFFVGPLREDIPPAGGDFLLVLPFLLIVSTLHEAHPRSVTYWGR